MKKFLLLALFLGLPSPLFAAQESTSGYKTTATCYSSTSSVTVSLMKKEHANSRKWGVYTCVSGSCSWANKAVSYDTAKDKYNKKANYPKNCNRGDTYID